MYLFIKILLTSIIVVTISEIARRSTLLAGIIASIPLTSVLAITWLYVDTKNIKNVLDLSNSILIMIPPSIVFFIVFAICIKTQFDFISSLAISLLSTGTAYWLYIFLLERLGIRL